MTLAATAGTALIFALVGCTSSTKPHKHDISVQVQADKGSIRLLDAFIQNGGLAFKVRNDTAFGAHRVILLWQQRDDADTVLSSDSQDLDQMGYPYDLPSSAVLQGAVQPVRLDPRTRSISVWAGAQWFDEKVTSR